MKRLESQPFPGKIERADEGSDLLADADRNRGIARKDRSLMSKHSTPSPQQGRSANVPAWQPIETAPKDGTPILVSFGSMGIWRVFWSEPEWTDAYCIWCVDDNKHGPYVLRGFSDEGDRAPTHWMPLPPAPLANGEDAAR